MRQVGPVCGLLFIALFAGGCVAAPPEASKAPEERLLASIRLIESAFKGPMSKKHGFFFHVRVPHENIGPVLEGSEFREGKLVDEFGGASSSADVIAAIENVGLKPFDFDAEVVAARERLVREAQARGEDVIVAGSRDGAEWEIVVATPQGELRLRAWNPRSTIDYFAPYSENLAKLKQVLDLLSQFYGDLKIGT